MWLTQEERDKFAEYLEQNAKDEKLMIGLMEIHLKTYPKELVDRKKEDVKAFVRVAKWLRSWE